MILLENFYYFSIFGGKLLFLENKEGEWSLDIYYHEENEFHQIAEGQKEGKAMTIEKLSKKVKEISFIVFLYFSLKEKFLAS